MLINLSILFHFILNLNDNLLFRTYIIYDLRSQICLCR